MDDLDLLFKVIEVKNVIFMLGFFIRPSNDGTYYVMALSVCPFTFACERDILNTACTINFKLSYNIYTSNTLVVIDFGHSGKNKMAAISV